MGRLTVVAVALKTVASVLNGLGMLNTIYKDPSSLQ